MLFSLDCKFLASGSKTGGIHFLSLQDGSRDTVYEHSTAICDLSFSPDGSLLASASIDNVIRIWDTTENNKPFRLNRGMEHSTYIRAFKGMLPPWEQLLNLSLKG